MMKEIIVIGGGASGMMAAITAAGQGAEVLLLEQKEQLGKKLLATGNGRCNFTNMYQEPVCYRGSDLSFPWQALGKFGYQETIRFFLELGIYSRNRNGYLYPHSDQASAVLDVLRMELARLNVEVHLKEAVRSAVFKRLGEQAYFEVETDARVYQAENVILSAGGKAAPKTGSDGSGYALAEGFGHTLVPVLPALVQLRCREKSYRQLAGIRVQAKISLYIGEECTAVDTGEILLTEYGLSGIPVFQVSRYASQGLYEEQKVTAYLDFMPDFTEEQFFLFLKNRAQTRPERTAAEFFTGLLHRKLAALLVRISGVHDDWTVGGLSEEDLKKLVRAVKAYRTDIIGTNSFDQAQVCAGGVSTAELDAESMQSVLVPGLYLTGELVDVDGMCGGYNLQWAWTSGYLAGRAAAGRGKETAVDTAAEKGGIE